MVFMWKSAWPTSDNKDYMKNAALAAIDAIQYSTSVSHKMMYE